MKKIITLFACFLAILASMAVQAQEPVQTNRSTELRVAPDETAAVLQTLADRTAVIVQQRRGPWSQVKVGNTVGWVRMMHLRGGSSVVVEQQSTTGGYFSSMSRLFLGGGGDRTSQNRQSATVGIRGFSKEDVAKAEYNPVDFEKLKRFQVNDGDAQRFAAQGRLAFRSVAYLSQDAIDGAAVKGARK